MEYEMLMVDKLVGNSLRQLPALYSVNSIDYLAPKP